MRGVILVRRFLASEEFSGFLHSLRNGHIKRAARFAGPASNAFGRGMRQGFIMRLYGGRNFRLHGCEIIELIDHGDIELCGTGFAAVSYTHLDVYKRQRQNDR